MRGKKNLIPKRAIRYITTFRNPFQRRYFSVGDKDRRIFLEQSRPYPPPSHPRFYFRHIRTVYKSVRFPPPTRPKGFCTSISTPDCLNVHQRPTHTKEKKNSCRLSVRRSTCIPPPSFVFVYGKVGEFR